ncbi:hypothetical protein BSIN_0049 [Burkholderia singularis]|uniref:Uncharacterized protein n=1 Tax=Burkholderia singularis TaxID=1503053 RepID=A0A238H235_9BURK|nr:hypothetical protein BSIN_0049 [Burkholderia singularis]
MASARARDPANHGSMAKSTVRRCKTDANLGRRKRRYRTAGAHGCRTNLQQVTQWLRQY